MNRTLVPLLLIAAAALAAGYWAGGRHAATDQSVDHESATAEGGGTARKLLYYRNPMGLPDTSPVPKQDSMGMDYIPVYDGEEPDDSGVVKVSPARVQVLGVRTAPAERRAIEAAVRAVGRVEVNERAIHEVAPRFEGWVERLFVNATGDPVRRGEPLFSAYSPELISAHKELAIAESLKLDGPDADPAARAGAERLAAAARERLANWEVSSTDAASRRITFRAPATGIVLEKQAVEGMRFTPGMTIYRIADLSTVWIIADLYEQDLARVRVGERGTVTIDAFPGRRFEARVTYLYPTLNVPTRTTPVRLELDNREGLLRPGMFAHVALATGGDTPRLTVPASAVIDTGNRQVVLVALEEGRYKPQQVTVGLRDRDHVEILEGLRGGERVVVSANFLIDAESNLMAALNNFGAPEETGAKRYQAEGSLEGVDTEAGTVTLTHAPIPELQWPAMTMEFGLASPAQVEGVTLGAPIRFTFEDRGDGEFVVTGIESADSHDNHSAGGGH